MENEKMRELVQMTVKATLHELFYDQIPYEWSLRNRDRMDRFHHELDRFSFMVEKIEKRWPSPEKCRYSKDDIDTIIKTLREIKDQIQN